MAEGARQLNLFLVEDSPADVFLVREAMESEGLAYRLTVAADGEVATQMLNRVDAGADPPPHLLLIDLNVPRRDGIQVLERMRRSAWCDGVPVIVISSSDSPSDRQRAFALGATDYFRKPSTLDEFLRLGGIVDAACRKARSSAA